MTILCSRTEAAPLCLQEALAIGIPVVAMDCGGTSEIVEHERTGLLVADGLARISHEEVAKGLISWHNWFI